MSKKSILITGCSSGIGLASAQFLSKNGCQVFASARKIEDVKRLEASGFESIQLDVTDENSIDRALEQICAKTGGTLYALFNNAGYMQTGAIEDVTIECVRTQFETNFFGLVSLTKKILPLMRRQGYGRIVQNSSVLGIVTIPFYGIYAASKFAVEGFSQTLRQELYDTNIFISIINPGPIDSKIRKTAYTHFKESVNKESFYNQQYQKLETTYFKNDQQLSQSPEVVIKKLIHALESKRPRIHYYPGWPASTVAAMHRLLPECWVSWFLAKTRG